MVESILADWKAGQDWRVGNGLHRQDFDPEEVVIDPADPDAQSLRATREFLIYFVHEMNHGDRKFDGLSWDEAVTVLEETGERLRARLPIEDQRVLGYVTPATRRPKLSSDDQVRGLRLLGCVYCAGAVGAITLSILPLLRADGRDVYLALGFGVLGILHFIAAEYTRRKPTQKSNDAVSIPSEKR